VATALLAVLPCLCPPMGATQDQPPAGQERKDNVFGTVHEGIVMETDPDTGDRIIQVTPKPKNETQQTPQVLIIQPEIEVKTKY
jgi:hypothetical protein